MGNGENTELLDLKMKTTESSYPHKRTMFMAPSSHPHFFAPSGKETGDDGGSGGGDFVGSDIYDVLSSGAAALSSTPLQQPFNTSASTEEAWASLEKLLLQPSSCRSFKDSP
ncbi:hypothetical protein HAX54_026251 [Datura stramonium]|uniref:Uncharacterized protein n=1 Tax=Datura stramonium TaxID=4076 RepID=A0ABS8V111_DATST|nr:hypothetical protein [Datura stramonium]